MVAVPCERWPSMWGNPVRKFDRPRMPASWWLRPVSSAARVGEHRGVTWKLVNTTPSAARASMFGVSMSEPKHPSWAKPVSSRTITSTSGAPGPGSGGVSKSGVDSANVAPIVPSKRSVRMVPPGAAMGSTRPVRTSGRHRDAMIAIM